MGFWSLHSNDSTITRFCFRVAVHTSWSRHSFRYISRFSTPSPSPCGLPILSENLLLVHVIYIDSRLLINPPAFLTTPPLGRGDRSAKISRQRSRGFSEADPGTYTAKRTERRWPRVLRMSRGCVNARCWRPEQAGMGDALAVVKVLTEYGMLKG